MTLFWSNSGLGRPEVGANRWSHKTIEAVVNAKNMTNPVYVGMEVATPWRAGGGESRMPGSEGGWGNRLVTMEVSPSALRLPYPTDPIRGPVSRWGSAETDARFL